jgi:hypothetical protein
MSMKLYSKQEASVRGERNKARTFLNHTSRDDDGGDNNQVGNEQRKKSIEHVLSAPATKHEILSAALSDCNKVIFAPFNRAPA